MSRSRVTKEGGGADIDLVACYKVLSPSTPTVAALNICNL